MCGIIAYIGTNKAYPILINGLRQLEYRGYDSAGLALVGASGAINVTRAVGKVSVLEDRFLKNGGADLQSSIGIGHTRWATHGEPSEVNAHPQTSQHGDVILVHNGVIDNYYELKELLENEGYTFTSQTDTEVLANLIEHVMRVRKLSLIDAVRFAFSKTENNIKIVHGAYALAILSPHAPHTLVVVRNGSPISIGEGKDKDYYFASGTEGFLANTDKAHVLADGEMAYVDEQGQLHIQTIEDGKATEPYFRKLTYSLQEIQKGKYAHFMLKEINEQPHALAMGMKGRITPTGEVSLSMLQYLNESLTRIDSITLLGCGTSLHAAMVGRSIIQQLTGIKTHVEDAAEYRYNNPVTGPYDLVILVSQSGETKDTLEAGNLVKSFNSIMSGVCNVVGSSIPHITATGIYTHAGPEIGVASTKAFTSQVLALILFAIGYGAKTNRLRSETARAYLKELETIPGLIEALLPQMEHDAKQIAVYLNERYEPKLIERSVNKLFGKSSSGWKVNNALFLGRGYGYPLALEGALKLKEVSYIHAEGMSAAAMKHGTIALIDENMPVIVIATDGPQYDKVLSNMQEVKARKGNIISIVSQGDTKAHYLSHFSFEVPKVTDFMSPLLVTPLLQLIAYHTAIGRGCDVDNPRNLAKAVTVE